MAPDLRHPQTKWSSSRPRAVPRTASHRTFCSRGCPRARPSRTAGTRPAADRPGRRGRPARGPGRHPHRRTQGEKSRWIVMADPDGNEFCVLRAFTAGQLAELGLRLPSRAGQQLICSDFLSRGRVRRPSRLVGAGASCFVGRSRWLSVSLATRGQADMRGLVTAGRAVRLERIACLGSSVAGRERRLLIAVSRVAPRAAATAVVDEAVWVAGYSSSTARDQHQPASSRAMATLAITWPSCGGRGRCSSGGAGAGCRRRRGLGRPVPASSQRSRMVLPTR